MQKSAISITKTMHIIIVKTFIQCKKPPCRIFAIGKACNQDYRHDVPPGFLIYFYTQPHHPPLDRKFVIQNLSTQILQQHTVQSTTGNKLRAVVCKNKWSSSCERQSNDWHTSEFIWTFDWKICSTTAACIVHTEIRKDRKRKVLGKSWWADCKSKI